MKRVAFICFMVILTPAAKPVDAVTRSTTAALVNDADLLYSMAAGIVARAPRTEEAASAIAGSSGRDFHVRERRFQDQVLALNTPAIHSSPAALQEAILRLAQFDNFVFDAVGSTLGTCSIAEGRANLRIAHQLLEHAHMALNGHPQPDWDPDLNAPDSSGTCS